MKTIFWFLIGFFIGDLIDQLIFSKGIIARFKELFITYYSYKSAKAKLDKIYKSK